MSRRELLAILPAGHPARAQIEGTAKAPAHKAGVMNKLERRYAARLDLAGESWKFEAVTLILSRDGRGTRYTPDFMVDGPTGMEFHEVKGFMRDDAQVKIRWAAKEFPQFKFRLCVWHRKEQRWDVRLVRGDGE